MYRAVGYVKVRDESEVSSIRGYAEKMGLKNIRIYEDYSIERTGNIDVTLGGIFSLLEDCANNPYIIIVIVQDRSDLVRIETDVNFLEELAIMGKTIVVVGSSISKKVLKKIKRGTVSPSRSPVSQSGPVPYGYRRFDIGGSFFIEPHEIESSIVKTIFKKYSELGSFAKVQRYLNEASIKTRRGNSWSRAGLSWMLKNYVYAGKTKIGSEMVDSHVALVDPGTFNKVQEVMFSRRRGADV